MCWHNSSKANHKTAEECNRKCKSQTRTHTKEKITTNYVRFDSIHNIRIVKLKGDRGFLPEYIDCSVTFIVIDAQATRRRAN
jgi:hypothetical protein